MTRSYSPIWWPSLPDHEASDGAEKMDGIAMQILHINCSPRGEVSESHRMARKIVELLLVKEPTAVLTNRILGGGTIGHIDASYATALGATQPSFAETFPRGTMSRSEELIQELESSDYVVIGTPMHNFAVPSALKAWIDHVVRVRRTFNATKSGYVGTLRDRPVFVVVSSGGRYTGERARQPDFLTPYLKAVFDVIGLRSLTFFSVEGSSLGLDALAKARREADLAVQEYFSSCCDVPQPQ